MPKEIPMEAIEQYKAGEAVGPIAKRIGVSPNTLADFLRKEGVLRSKSEAKSLGWKKMTPEAKENRRPKHVGRTIDAGKCDELFKAGSNPSQIAQTLGVNSQRVKEILVEIGHKQPDRLERNCQACSVDISDTHKHRLVCETCIPNKKFSGTYQRFGITKPIWDQMLIKQDGHCALCFREASCVDHDHRTGRVRGLVCNGCNFALSRLDEDTSWMIRANEYVSRSS